MRQMPYKGYGRIYVQDAKDVERVRDIIKEMDEFEHSYLPKDLVAPFSEYPTVTYTHKFDRLDLDTLTAICWHRSILVWCVENGTHEWMPDKVLLHEKEKALANETQNQTQ